MGKSKNFRNGNQKRDGGRFVAIPSVVFNGRAYLSLGAQGRMLLMDLLAQYKGNNNGDLCASFKLMKTRGWKSTHTLYKAKQELLESGLIVETRKGSFPSKASLYALTCYALDDCNGKLDIEPSGFPRGAYRLKDPTPPIRK